MFFLVLYRKAVHAFSVVARFLTLLIQGGVFQEAIHRIERLAEFTFSRQRNGIGKQVGLRIHRVHFDACFKTFNSSTVILHFRIDPGTGKINIHKAGFQFQGFFQVLKSLCVFAGNGFLIGHTIYFTGLRVHFFRVIPLCLCSETNKGNK